MSIDKRIEHEINHGKFLLEKGAGEIWNWESPAGKIRWARRVQIALQKNIPWLKQKMGDSPDETAFFRWSISSLLKKYNFTQIEVIPFDFLHPAIPSKLIKSVSGVGNFIEKVPLMKEIAGSLYIRAVK